MSKVDKQQVTEWELQMVTKHEDMLIPKYSTKTSSLKHPWCRDLNLSFEKRLKSIIIPGLVALGTQWL